MATTKPVATFPAKTAQAPAVVAGPMSGKGFAALADGVAGAEAKKTTARKPAAKKAVAAKAPAKAAAKPAAKKAVAAPAVKAAVKPRSAAAKRATPVPVKAVAKKAAKPATAPAAVKPAKGEPTQHTVKNVKDLIKFLNTMPSGGSFDVDRKFGKAKIQVKNIRGRVIAEVQQIAK